jgi:hypothetical protein
MTKVHRQLLKRLDEVRAVNLDTAYGFQENVPQMTKKLLDYFQTSLHVAFAPLHFTSYEHSSELERTIFKQQVSAASYVFAGPGSPSYAMAQWRPLGLADDLEQVLLSGGTLCFSSAATATVGIFCPPIYEIYKVGTAPYWLDGLNLVASFGLNCVVIPHYDNQEGGNYDTSRCYLGERRLSLLEEMLPEGVATLGVDEHSALILDLENDTLQVLGKSHGYWRLNGDMKVLANGTTLALDELRSLAAPERQRTASPRSPTNRQNWAISWPAAARRPWRPSLSSSASPPRAAAASSIPRRWSTACWRRATALDPMASTNSPINCATLWSGPASTCRTAPTAPRGRSRPVIDLTTMDCTTPSRHEYL